MRVQEDHLPSAPTLLERANPMTTSKRVASAVMFKCHSLDEAKNLNHCLKQLFSELSFKWCRQSLKLYARQGPKQSIRDYLKKRQELRHWLAQLPEGKHSYQEKARLSAFKTVQDIKLKTHSDNVKIEAHRLDQLLHELIDLNNQTAFWLVYKQIRALYKQQNTRPFKDAAKGFCDRWI